MVGAVKRLERETLATCAILTCSVYNVTGIRLSQPYFLFSRNRRQWVYIPQVMMGRQLFAPTLPTGRPPVHILQTDDFNCHLQLDLQDCHYPLTTDHSLAVARFVYLLRMSRSQLPSKCSTFQNKMQNTHSPPAQVFSQMLPYQTSQQSLGSMFYELHLIDIFCMHLLILLHLQGHLILFSFFLVW